MLKNYCKTAFRNLLRHRTFSLINILGFAFSISVCLMIAVFIMKEYSTDGFYSNAGYMYKLVDTENNSSGIDYRVADIIVNNFPEIRSSCIVNLVNDKINVKYKNKGYTIQNIASVDNNYFEVFTIPFIKKSAQKGFKDINSVVLTESWARFIFGNDDPIGKEILLFDDNLFHVTGIIHDMPENSSLKAGIFINADNNKYRFSFNCQDSRDSGSYRYPYNVYLLLRNNTNAWNVANKINKHVEVLQPFVKKISLLALKDVYLSDNTKENVSQKGNPALLKILFSIAFIILILAVMNYINLSVAQQNRRNRETGIRKTIGAGRKDIIIFYLTESVIITFIAFVTGLLLCELALPYFENIVDAHLSSYSLLSFPVNIIIISSVLIIGLTAGVIPALLLSSFSPARIFSGNTIISGRKSYFRNILTVFQFTVSIALIFCTIIIQKQIDFAKYSDLGFDKEQFVKINLPSRPATKTAFVNKLKEYSNISDISCSNGTVGQIQIGMGNRINGKIVMVNCIAADSNFIKTFRIQLSKGREPIPGEYGTVCLINEAAYKCFGWSDIKNKRFENGGGFNVIGVTKDFHYTSMHKVIEPACILYTSDMTLSLVSLRIKQGKLSETMKYIQNSWKSIIPDQTIEYQFYDDVFNNMYKHEENFAKAIGLFTTLAVCISCLGILGLVIFASERRSKEIGIRKVHGAKISELMFMLNRDFLKWVLIASVIALPLGWYIINKWMQDFAYRTEISWWTFVLAGLSALVVAFLTVSWQTWKTVRRNPIEVLRYE